MFQAQRISSKIPGSKKWSRILSKNILEYMVELKRMKVSID